ncbi:MAG: hypothetical protein P4L45_09880 [Ignavibacteriaceae bacterium]|nr:hypothetical protein [Ignavibacteriaceae bacterium]
MSFGGWLILIAVVIIIISVIQYKQDAKRKVKRQQAEKLNQEEKIAVSLKREKWFKDKGYTITKKMELFFANKLWTIVVDDNKKLVIFDEKPVPYKVITNVELLSHENQTSTTSTGKTNGIGRAVAGGIIAGGAGAIVGAATANETNAISTNTSVVYTGVRVYLADIGCPRIEIGECRNRQFLLDVYSTLLAIIAQNQKNTTN